VPCLNPAKPAALEEVVGVGTVLRFSKSNATPSGVFNDTVTGFLGTNALSFTISTRINTQENYKTCFGISTVNHSKFNGSCVGEITKAMTARNITHWQAGEGRTTEISSDKTSNHEVSDDMRGHK
jgi:hypothetical protein